MLRQPPRSGKVITMATDAGILEEEARFYERKFQEGGL